MQEERTQDQQEELDEAHTAPQDGGMPSFDIGNVTVVITEENKP